MKANPLACFVRLCISIALRSVAVSSAQAVQPAYRGKALEKWMPTGPLITPRASHTATLLRNGKVLVAGGKNSTFNVLSSAEMYDPATGKWTKTGELNVPRWRHTATLLSNGKVLVAGGAVIVEATASAELYDPDAGEWTETADLKKQRYDHTATLLSNGERAGRREH
jgi:hypothetical protein